MRLALLLFLLALFDPSRGWAGNRFHERNHTGLLVLYGFDDGQRSSDLHPTSARDYTGLGLLGNLTTSTTTISWNASRAGFNVPSASGGFRAVSQRTTAELLEKFDDEFSIEMFFTSPNNPTRNNWMIAGFGEWTPGAPFPTCDSSTPSPEGGWRTFASPGVGIRVQLVVSISTITPTCLELGFGNTPFILRHATFRGRPQLVDLLSQGDSDIAPDPTIGFNPTFWTRTPAHLTFAIPHPTDGWTGSIYMFAVYNRYLSTAEINANYIYGPPNSLPVATTANTPLVITEDVTMTLYP